MSYRSHDSGRRDGGRRDSGRGGGGGGGSHRDSSSSLFIRNVSYDSKPEDLRKIFSRYGYVRDVYIPQDYHTREPRGFAYVEFEDGRDATDAMEELDGYRLHDRELEIVFAEGDRKNPNTMKRKEYGAARFGYGRRFSRSRSRSPRRRRRSRSPRRSRHSSERGNRSQSRSNSPAQSKSVSRSPSASHSRSRSPKQERKSGGKSGGKSVSKSKSKSISRSRSRE